MIITFLQQPAKCQCLGAIAGSTPLKQALARNQAITVEELLRLGADASLAKENDPTPIFYAASSGAPRLTGRHADPYYCKLRGGGFLRHFCH